MALLWYNGFHSYGDDETQLELDGYEVNGAVLSTGTGREGDYSLDCDSAGRSWQRTIAPAPSGATFWFGGTWKLISAGNESHAIWGIGNANGPDVVLGIDAARNLWVTRGTNWFYGSLFLWNYETPVLSTITDVAIATDVWYWLEIGGKIANDGTGWIQVWLNDVEILNLTSINTRGSASGNDFWNMYGFGASGSGFGKVPPLHRCSSYYILDGTTAAQGLAFDDRIGDCLVYDNVPDSDDVFEWDCSAGSDGFAMVDDRPQDGDTTYNSTNTTDEFAIFGFPDIPAEYETPLAVMNKVVAKKTDPGSRLIRPVFRTNSTDYEGADQGLTDSYAYVNDLRSYAPHDNAAWVSRARVHAYTLGHKATI